MVWISLVQTSLIRKIWTPLSSLIAIYFAMQIRKLMSILLVRSPSWVCIAGERIWEQKAKFFLCGNSEQEHSWQYICIFSFYTITNLSFSIVFSQYVCFPYPLSPLTLPSLSLSANCILRITRMRVFGEQRDWGGCNGESFLMRGKERWEDGRDL